MKLMKRIFSSGGKRNTGTLTSKQLTASVMAKYHTPEKDEIDVINSEKESQAREIFNTFDFNNDGFLTETELIYSLIKLDFNKSLINPESIRPIIKRYGRGTIVKDDEAEQQKSCIDLNGFLSLIKDYQKSRTQSKDDNEIYEAFKFFDVNSDCYITNEELHSAMLYLGFDLTHAQIKEMMQYADANSDGLIDKDEFLKVYRFYTVSEDRPQNEQEKN